MTPISTEECLRGGPPSYAKSDSIVRTYEDGPRLRYSKIKFFFDTEQTPKENVHTKSMDCMLSQVSWRICRSHTLLDQRSSVL